MEAPATSSSSRPSWNPLRCSGTATRPDALLAAKLLALSLLIERPPAPPLPAAMIAAAAFALLFNRRPRLFSALLGAAVVVAAAWSGAPPAGERVFLGLFLVAVGLERPGGEPRLARAAAVLYYGVAAASRVAGEAWFADRLLGEWTAVAEAALALGFAFGRSRSAAVWAGLFLHGGGALFGEMSLGDAGAAMIGVFPLAAYLAAVGRPREPMLVIYDGDCGICNRCRRVLERWDLDGVYRWAAFQSGVGERFGIARGALERAVHVVSNGEVHAGFRAVQAVLLVNPLTYFVAAAAWMTPIPGAAGRLAVSAAAITLFFPALRPLGEAAYAWVARNRRLFPGEGSCDVAPGAED